VIFPRAPLPHCRLGFATVPKVGACIEFILSPSDCGANVETVALNDDDINDGAECDANGVTGAEIEAGCALRLRLSCWGTSDAEGETECEEGKDLGREATECMRG
jgi:hypothetical protein